MARGYTKDETESLWRRTCDTFEFHAFTTMILDFQENFFKIKISQLEEPTQNLNDVLTFSQFWKVDSSICSLLLQIRCNV
jgi:hypothetical protein